MSNWMDKNVYFKSECESTIGEGNPPVERSIPTYTETIRRQYQKEVYERAEMYYLDDLENALQVLNDLIAQENDPKKLVALFTARACTKDEIRRRYRR